jgi:hypothetical protein
MGMVEIWEKLNAYTYYTEEAIDFVNKLPKNEKIIASMEQDYHDGYESDGRPKAYIWYLYLITFDDKNYKFYYLTWENRFRGENKEYELYYVNYVKNCIINSSWWDEIEIISNQDSRLNQYVRSISRKIKFRNVDDEIYIPSIIGFHATNSYYYLMSGNKNYDEKGTYGNFIIFKYDITTKKIIEKLSYDDFYEKYKKFNACKWMKKTVDFLKSGFIN